MQKNQKKEQIMAYQEREGDLVALSLKGEFDVIIHGCNCYCSQRAGIAAVMNKTFKTESFRMEGKAYKGDFNKLGTIDYQHFTIIDEKPILHPLGELITEEMTTLTVVNCYTQYGPGVANPTYGIPLDYDALTMCMRKLNREFKGEHIGIPLIGCGLAGGDWTKVSSIIKKELVNCDVTVVIFKP